jgi:hypothetical protein
MAWKSRRILIEGKGHDVVIEKRVPVVLMYWRRLNFKHSLK